VITQVALPAALAFIMLAMGLTLDLADFKQVVVRPKALAVGLLAKLLLLPLAALGVILVWRPDAEMAVGVVLLAACPAGVTSCLLTHLARGRASLAASVTIATSLAVTFSLPLLVNLALTRLAGQGAQGDLAIGKVVGGVLAVDALPLALGLMVRLWRPHWAERLGRVARPLATLLFAVIVVGAFVSQRQTLMDHMGDIGPMTLALNLAAMAAGWGAGRLAGLGDQDRVALMMETGLQNNALGIFVALTLLDRPALMVPSIVYAFVMNITAVLVISGRRQARALSL
jgi:BASS family bile acid:Na+ symporter